MPISPILLLSRLTTSKKLERPIGCSSTPYAGRQKKAFINFKIHNINWCGCGCGACREAVLWAAIPSRASRFDVIVLTMEDDDVMDEEHQWRGNWNVAKCVAAAIKRSLCGSCMERRV
ncbi:hypothetical protein Tco_0826965 [Tanacetum coccineum]